MPVLLGTGGEIRTLEASLEDSNVSSYITPAERISDCGLRIADLKVSARVETVNKSAFRNLQSEIVELLAGLEPATSTFEASRSSKIELQEHAGNFGFRISNLYTVPESA